MRVGGSRSHGGIIGLSVFLSNAVLVCLGGVVKGRSSVVWNFHFGHVRLYVCLFGDNFRTIMRFQGLSIDFAILSEVEVSQRRE